jgi:hypothetical protein
VKFEVNYDGKKAAAGFATQKVSMYPGGFMKEFSFDVDLAFSTGGIISRVFRVHRLLIQLGGKDFDFIGSFSQAATGMAEGMLGMRDPVSFPFLGPRVGFIIRRPLDEPIQLKWMLDPVTSRIGLGMRAEVIMDATRSIPFRNIRTHGQDAGLKVYQYCLGNRDCATVKFDFFGTIMCMPQPCRPQSLDLDLEIPQQISVLTPLQAIIGKSFPTAMKQAGESMMGTIGPGLVSLRADPFAPQNFKFEMRGALQPPGGALGMPAIMMSFKVLPQQLKIEASAVMAAGCIGITSGGCTGIKIEPTDTGKRVWNEITTELKKDFYQWNNNKLPAKIDTVNEAGPGFLFKLGTHGMEFALEANARLVVGAIPQLSSFLPMARVKVAAKITHGSGSFVSSVYVRGWPFPGVSTLVESSLSYRISPFSFNLNRFYIKLDTRNIIQGLRNAIKAINSALYWFANLIGIFNIFDPKFFSFEIAGSRATIKLSVVLIGKQFNLALSIDFKVAFDIISKAVKGDVSILKKFAESLIGDLERNIRNRPPCDCKPNTCYNRRRKYLSTCHKTIHPPCLKTTRRRHKTWCAHQPFCGVYWKCHWISKRICVWRPGWGRRRRWSGYKNVYHCWHVSVRVCHPANHYCCKYLSVPYWTTCPVSVPYPCSATRTDRECEWQGGWPLGAIPCLSGNGYGYVAGRWAIPDLGSMKYRRC